MHARALVGAMLAPHHREHAELSEIRFPPQNLDDLLVFLVGQIVLANKVFGDHSINRLDRVTTRREFTQLLGDMTTIPFNNFWSHPVPPQLTLTQAGSAATPHP